MTDSGAIDGAGEPRFMFVYGSLRPGDNSGMSWTKSFLKGINVSVRGPTMLHSFTIDLPAPFSAMKSRERVWESPRPI
jgi:hypothetical protein